MDLVRIKMPGEEGIVYLPIEQVLSVRVKPNGEGVITFQDIAPMTVKDGQQFVEILRGFESTETSHSSLFEAIFGK